MVIRDKHSVLISSVLNVKALLGAFNQEKALVASRGLLHDHDYELSRGPSWIIVNIPSGLPGPRAPRRRGREQQDTAEARLEM